MGQASWSCAAGADGRFVLRRHQVNLNPAVPFTSLKRRVVAHRQLRAKGCDLAWHDAGLAKGRYNRLNPPLRHGLVRRRAAVGVGEPGKSDAAWLNLLRPEIGDQQRDVTHAAAVERRRAGLEPEIDR